MKLTFVGGAGVRIPMFVEACLRRGPRIGLDELCGASRSRQLVTARQIAMYLCRELTDLSLPKIGQLFGGRDHTTVMHAERKIRESMAERRPIYDQVTELTNRIRMNARGR